MFHRQNVAEGHPMLLFRLRICSLSYYLNTSFLYNSAACHLKSLLDRSKPENILEFSAKDALGFTYFGTCEKK
jgi:hypothetical protein